ASRTLAWVRATPKDACEASPCPLRSGHSPCGAPPRPLRLHRPFSSRGRPSAGYEPARGSRPRLRPLVGLPEDASDRGGTIGPGTKQELRPEKKGVFHRRGEKLPAPQGGESRRLQVLHPFQGLVRDLRRGPGALSKVCLASSRAAGGDASGDEPLVADGAERSSRGGHVVVDPVDVERGRKQLSLLPPHFTD